MWKFIILAIAAYFLYRLFANDFLKKRKEEEKLDKEEQDKRIAAGDMVKDPQCGAYVSVEDSISVKDGDKTWYFCSYDCRDEFLKKREGGVLPPREDN